MAVVFAQKDQTLFWYLQGVFAPFDHFYAQPVQNLGQ